MLIGAFRGRSLLSRVIRFRTWSRYSHAGLIKAESRDDLMQGPVESIEAWIRDGVVHLPDVLNGGHTPGTVIDLFDMPEMPEEAHKLAWEIHRSQIGKAYSMRGALKFFSRREGINAAVATDAVGSDPYPEVKSWFCSQLVAQSYIYARRPLLRAPAYKTSPAMLTYSPLVRYIGRVVTEGRGEEPGR